MSEDMITMCWLFVVLLAHLSISTILLSSLFTKTMNEILAELQRKGGSDE